MSSRKGHTGPFVRCYEVGSPTLHQDGYTIYKVTQQVPVTSWTSSHSMLPVFIGVLVVVLVIHSPNRQWDSCMFHPFVFHPWTFPVWLAVFHTDVKFTVESIVQHEGQGFCSVTVMYK